jgi:hypothetical protein
MMPNLKPAPHVMFPSPPLLLAGMLTLLAATPVCAVDLFSFRDASGRVLAFAVPDTDVISRS